MQVVEHQERAFINDRRVTFGTTRRFFEEAAAEDSRRFANGGPSRCVLSVEQHIARSIGRGYPQYWVIVEEELRPKGACIQVEHDGDEKRKKLTVGETVEMEERVFQIEAASDGNFRLTDLTLGYTLNSNATVYETVAEASTVAASLSHWILWRLTSLDTTPRQMIGRSSPETFEDSGVEHVATLADQVALSDKRDGTKSLYRLQCFNDNDEVWTQEPYAPGELAALMPLLQLSVEVEPTIGWRLWPA